MKNSILVFGVHSFLSTLPQEIINPDSSNLEVIGCLHEAQSHLQVKLTDIILVQASQEGSIELCSWLKEQSKLSWIHCILFEDRLELLKQKARETLEWELSQQAQALHQGADAYIWQICNDENTCNLPSCAANYQLIIAQFRAGLRKAKKYRDLEEKNDILSAIAREDSLTELNNRRALDDDLPRQIKRAITTITPLSLIILDIDFFKKVNDTYGHLVGDRLLQLLCKRVQHNLRLQDKSFRYGGEEFVILLPNTTLDEALNIAHRLNRIVAEQGFIINKNLIINITISLGVGTLEIDDDPTGKSLLNRADLYLLEAKSTGRNKVRGGNGTSHVSANSYSK